MAEPNITCTLTLTETERDLLERLIVTAAPAMGRADQNVALDLWERVAKDTVAT